jgi:hypothetical protein
MSLSSRRAAVIVDVNVELPGLPRVAPIAVHGSAISIR